ncbi:unnamed protein product [Calypogeia fissa]
MDYKGDRQSSRLVKDIFLMATAMTVPLFLGFISVCLLLFWRSFMLPLLSVRLTSGPRRIPIVGDMLTMKQFELSVQDFADEPKRKLCCPIMTLWAGSKPVLIISGPQMFNFGGTHLPSKLINLNFGNEGLTSRHSERHRFRRKLAVRNAQILSKKWAVKYRSFLDREVLSLVAESRKIKLQGGADSKGGNIVFTRTLTLEDHYMELDEVLLQRFQMGVSNLGEFIPSTSQLALMGEKTSEIFESQVEETKQKSTLKSGKTQEGAIMDNALLGLQRGEIFVISTNVNDLQFCGFLIL